MTTGRTVSKFTRFVVNDSGSTLREIPVSTINGVGLTFDEKESWALQDAIKSVLSDTPDCPIDISGPFDNSAAVTVAASGLAPALSGSHTVLKDINGVMTPLSLGIYFGIRGYWATGDPTFGLTASSTSGFICTSYVVDPASATYTAKFRCFPGSSAPEWGTSAVT